MEDLLDDVSVAHEKRVDEQASQLPSRSQLQRLLQRRLAVENRGLNKSVRPLRRDLRRVSKQSAIGRCLPSLAVSHKQKLDSWSRSVRQWLVPSDRVILLWTLYFPEGFDMGIRLTSCSVAAS